jgi:hypothetical protein
MTTHFFVSGTKMIDPNRCIRENQFGRTRRRGISFDFGIVPPRDANLRALSRSIRALRASRTNAGLASVDLALQVVETTPPWVR